MQPKAPVYKESQHFRQWWLWLIVLPGPLFLSWATITELFQATNGNESLGTFYVLALFTVVFGLALPVFLYRAGLETEVYDNALCLRFVPIHRNWQIFDFASITTSESVTYRPIRDYGGWGIRYGGPGKAYNVSGNKGALITFVGGKTLLIGSRHHEKLAAAIHPSGVEE